MGFLRKQSCDWSLCCRRWGRKEGRREEGRSSTSRSSTSRRSRRGRQEEKEEEEGRQVNWTSLDILLFFQTSSIVIYMKNVHYIPSSFLVISFLDKHLFTKTRHDPSN